MEICHSFAVIPQLRLHKSIYFIVLLSSVSSQIPTPPVDQAGSVGDDVTLKCRVVAGFNDRFQWVEFITDTSNTRIYHTHFLNMTSDPTKYEISGRYDLIVKNILLEDGGRYQCEEDVMTTRRSAKILVFETPVIDTHSLIENIPTNLSCTSTFTTMKSLTPAEYPDVTLTVNGVEQSGVQSDVTHTDSATREQAAYVVTGTVPYVANARDNGEKVECIITSKTRDLKTFRQEVILNISFAAQSITFENDKDFYEAGEDIACEARGNPKPHSYKWLSTKDGEITGNTLKVTANMTTEDDSDVIVWKCLATNTVNGTNHTTSSTKSFQIGNESEVTIATTEGIDPNETGSADKSATDGGDGGPPSKIGAIVGGVVGGLVVVCIVCVGGYFGAKKHRENKEKKRMDAENNSGVVNGGATGKDHEDDVVSPYAINDLPNRGPEANAYRPQSTQYADPDAVVPGRKQPPKFGNSNDYALAGHPNKQEPDPNIVYGKVNKQPAKEPATGDRGSTVIVDNATYTPYEPKKSPPKTKKPNRLPPIASTTNDSRPPVSQKPNVSGRSINV